MAGKKPHTAIICALCWSDQILHSCFETTLSVLAYFLTMAAKAGSQKLSEGSIGHRGAPALLSLTFCCEVLTESLAARSELGLGPALSRRLDWRPLEVSSTLNDSVIQKHQKGIKRLAHTRMEHMEHYWYQATINLQSALNVIILSAKVHLNPVIWSQSDIGYSSKSTGWLCDCICTHTLCQYQCASHMSHLWLAQFTCIDLHSWYEKQEKNSQK